MTCLKHEKDDTRMLEEENAMLWVEPKKVLDFLAKRSGLVKAVIKPYYGVWSLCFESNRLPYGTRDNVEFIYSDSASVIDLGRVSTPLSFDESLKKILDKSAEGHAVKMSDGKTFLEPHMTLEKIKIMMDLETSIE